ncbi:MAG: hypothetical protein WAW54_05830, partial [Parvibaculum sedimenti]|uniref:hypothetical protein n=1 Tax=Parvibaculum sedimenti TaxID=2608632 RepID=UPI003BB4ED58
PAWPPPITITSNSGEFIPRLSDCEKLYPRLRFAVKGFERSVALRPDAVSRETLFADTKIPEHNI